MPLVASVSALITTVAFKLPSLDELLLRPIGLSPWVQKQLMHLLTMCCYFKDAQRMKQEQLHWKANPRQYGAARLKCGALKLI